MTTIVEVDPVEQLAVVQPGVVTADLDAAAAEHGLWYPPDPSSWRESTVGGNVATDAGGLCCVRWGTTGAYVLGLEVVLASGEVLRTGRRTRKGVAGLDLTSLLVGSEGLLGVITEVTVRLRPRRPAPATALAVFDLVPACGAAVTAVSAAGLSVELMEVMDRTTLRAVEAFTRMGLGEPAALLVVQVEPHDLKPLEELLRRSGATEVHVTEDAAEAEALLQARRLALPALQAQGPVLLDDVCVPVGSLAAALAGIEQVAERTGARIGTFGHAGDGNLHPTIAVDDEAAAQRAFAEVLELALSLGGTSTGEHGVGVLKAPWLEQELGATSVAAQRAVKRALDPDWLMNPGKVL
jgi:glycolate oxidase